MKTKTFVCTFFIIPVLRLLKVVYRRTLFLIYSILILTRPSVFFPARGRADWSGLCTLSLSTLASFWFDGPHSSSESSESGIPFHLDVADTMSSVSFTNCMSAIMHSENYIYRLTTNGYQQSTLQHSSNIICKPDNSVLKPV